MTRQNTELYQFFKQPAYRYFGLSAFRSYRVEDADELAFWVFVNLSNAHKLKTPVVIN